MDSYDERDHQKVSLLFQSFCDNMVALVIVELIFHRMGSS